MGTWISTGLGGLRCLEVRKPQIVDVWSHWDKSGAGLQVRITWKLGSRYKIRNRQAQGPGLRGLPRLVQLPSTTPLLTLGKCQLGAGELLCLCWDLGFVWPTPSKEWFPFPAAREEMGICVQPAGFRLYLPVYVPWCPGPFTCMQTLHLHWKLPPHGFKHLLSRLGVDGKTKTFGSCWLLFNLFFKQAFNHRTCVCRAIGSL